MKKIIILLFIITIFTGVVGAADFRDVNWGMSKMEIISREGQPDAEEEYILAYKVELFGANFVLGYYFYEDTLTDARYVLRDSDIEGQAYKTLIKKLDEGLIEAYGQPTGGGMFWLDDTYKYNDKKFDLAVRVGDAVFKHDFKNETMNVTFRVIGDNHDDLFFVFYRPKDPKLNKLEEKRKEEKKK